MSFIAPIPLRPGDRVAVIAPAGPFDRERFETGLAVLAQRYQPVFDERLFQSHRYLAGTDASRLAQVNEALADETIRAVFAARGGYGSMRLLPGLRLHEPKWLVGFSDITALHLFVQQRGWQSLHAPVLTQLGTQTPALVKRVFGALEGTVLPMLRGAKSIVAGVVEGPLIGGNLSVLSRLIGTPYLPSLEGAVLLLEDVGERPYRLDRMWTHLVLSGALAGVRGVVLGDFTGCDDKEYGSADILEELAVTLGVPCASGFPIGHGEVNEPVVLGSTVRLDASNATLEVRQ